MSKQPIVRANPQTAEDKHPKHYVADWWIYAVLALFERDTVLRRLQSV